MTIQVAFFWSVMRKEGGSKVLLNVGIVTSLHGVTTQKTAT
jgi:hypothetical protein